MSWCILDVRTELGGGEEEIICFVFYFICLLFSLSKNAQLSKMAQISNIPGFEPGKTDLYHTHPAKLMTPFYYTPHPPLAYSPVP